MSDRPPTVERASAMPGRVWYLVAGGIGLVTATAFVMIVLDGVMGIGDGMPQMLAPGEVEMVFGEPGTYTVFHEHESVFEERYYSSPDVVSGLTVRVRPASGGAAVRVRPTSINANYTMGSRAGVGIFEFDIDQPGRYRVSALYANGQATPVVVLAVAHDFMGGLLVTIFSGLGVMFVGLGLTISIAVVTFVKREKALKAIKGEMTS